MKVKTDDFQRYDYFIACVYRVSAHQLMPSGITLTAPFSIALSPLYHIDSRNS